MESRLITIKIQRHVKNLLQEKLSSLIGDENIAIIFPCSYRESIDIYHSYVTGEFILQSKYHPAIQAVIEHIKAEHLFDKIHILPVSTYFIAKNTDLIIHKKILDNDLLNIFNHYEDNSKKWNFLNFQKNNLTDETMIDFQYFFEGKNKSKVGKRKNFSKLFFAKNKEIPFLSLANTDAKLLTCQEYFQHLFNSIFMGDHQLLRLNFLDEINFRTTAQVPQTFESFVRNQILTMQEESFLCKFSPSFNFRIVCQSASHCNGLKAHFNEFEVKDLRNAVIENKESSKVQKKAAILSIHSSRVTDFFEKLGISRPMIEHAYRYGYLIHKYCIKKGNLRHKEDKYYDLKYIAATEQIDFNQGEPITIDEFMKKDYATKYKTCSFKDKVTNTLEKSRIREEDIRYFFTYIINDGKKFRFYATPLINHEYINHHFKNPFCEVLAPRQIPILSYCLQDSVQCQTQLIMELANRPSSDDEKRFRAERLKSSIQILSKYFYISFTTLIVAQFKQIEINDPNFNQKIASLQELKYKISSFVTEILNSNSRLAAPEAFDNFLFFFYVFEEVAIYAYLKGNLFLFESLAEIFNLAAVNDINLPASSTILQNYQIIKNISSKSSIDDNLELLSQYTYTDNMIVLPFLSFFAVLHVPLTLEMQRRISLLDLTDAVPNYDVCNAVMQVIPTQELNIMVAGDNCSAEFRRQLLPMLKSHVSVVVDCCTAGLDVNELEFETILSSRASIVSKVFAVPDKMEVLLDYNFSRPVIIGASVFEGDLGELGYLEKKEQ